MSVETWIDPEAGLREWLALGKAPNADALHRVLVMHRPIRHSADTLEPLGLLRRIHETEPEETFTTAFLLLTDRRWRKGVSRLVRQVEESALLGDDELDELARLFIAADRGLFWEVPDEWFGDDVIVIGELHDDDHDAEHVEALIGRTGAVDARAAAALMAGLLDRADGMDAEHRNKLVDDAIGWPDHSVRRSGIEMVALRDGVEAAYRLAVEDPNARIRDWAPSLLADRPGDAGPDEEGDEPLARASRDDQQSLF